MSSANAFKWLLTAVLLLSIGWKIAIPSERHSKSMNGLVEFLERNHFNVVVIEGDVPMIRAQNGSCRLQVVRLASGKINGILFGNSLSGEQITLLSSFGPGI